MPAVVVTASEVSALEANAPSASDIHRAFVKYTPVRNRALGYWVGPTVRVTRTAHLGNFQTTAAWLYAWDDTPYTTQNWDALQERVRSAVQDGLTEIGAPLLPLPSGWTSTWSSVGMLPYNPTINGSVQWWQSGQASITHTRDQFPTRAGRLDIEENPTGPDTEDTHPTSIATVASSTVGTVGKLVPWVVGGVALWFLLPPLVRTLGSGRHARG